MLAYRRAEFIIILGLCCCAGFNSASAEPLPVDGPFDVVVYGGTSAGVIAAVQTQRMGKSVVLVCPDWLAGARILSPRMEAL